MNSEGGDPFSIVSDNPALATWVCRGERDWIQINGRNQICKKSEFGNNGITCEFCFLPFLPRQKLIIATGKNNKDQFLQILFLSMEQMTKISILIFDQANRVLLGKFLSLLPVKNNNDLFLPLNG